MGSIATSSVRLIAIFSFLRSKRKEYNDDAITDIGASWRDGRSFLCWGDVILFAVTAPC